LPKQWKLEDELSEAIRALMYRIESLQAESVTRDIHSNSVNVAVQESAFRNTVREVFGTDSPEFEEFGNTQMFCGPLRVGMSNSEKAQAKLRGREYMVQVCSELITRLQQKIHELRRKIEAGELSRPSPGQLHPVIAAATQELMANGHLWEAVFAASKALVLHVKNQSGRHDIDGVPLMRTVFSKNNPILKFNSMATTTDLDEQEGMMHLFEGAVMAIRNPGGHGFPTGSDTLGFQYIQLLGLLATRADEASR
jgi:uncharacterized protein (TIGR02391 family)